MPLHDRAVVPWPTLHYALIAFRRGGPNRESIRPFGNNVRLFICGRLFRRTRALVCMCVIRSRSRFRRPLNSRAVFGTKPLRAAKWHKNLNGRLSRKSMHLLSVWCVREFCTQFVWQRFISWQLIKICQFLFFFILYNNLLKSITSVLLAKNWSIWNEFKLHVAIKLYFAACVYVDFNYEHAIILLSASLFSETM